MEQLTGTVVFLLTNEGSKSESRLPFLYINKNEIVKIYFHGDNPFENPTLQQYDGKTVEIRGKMKSNRSFVIEQITIATKIAEDKPQASLPR